MASEDHYHIFQWHFLNSQSLFLLVLFFIILILVFTLFLCANFCLRHFSPPPTAAAAAVVTSPLPPHQWIGVDFTIHSVHTLSTTTKSLGLVDSGFEKNECCICLSLFQENEKVKVLKKCQHFYHDECLDRWLRAHPSCPICRTSLQVSNVQVE